MKKAIYFACLVALLATGCAFGANTARGGFRLTQQAGGFFGGTDTPAATDTPFPTDTLTPVPVPTATPTVRPQMFPMVTFAQNANCRLGPAVNYFSFTAYTKGQTAEIDGRNEDGSWFWIRVDDNRDYCWVAAATVVNFGDVSALNPVIYQTLPSDPIVTISKEVCAHPNVIEVDWTEVQGAQGYRIYRIGELIQTNTQGILFYRDYPRNAKTFQYSIEAFNQYGVSNRIGVTVPGCK